MRDNRSGRGGELEEGQESSDLGDGQGRGGARGGHVAEHVGYMGQPVDIPVVEPVGDEGDIGREDS